MLNSPKRNKPQTVLIRVLTNYFQVVMLVKDFDLHWPPQVKSVLGYFSYVSSSQDEVFSFDCIYKQLGIIKTSTFYVQVVMYGLLPIILTLLSSVFWIVVKLTIKSKD